MFPFTPAWSVLTLPTNDHYLDFWHCRLVLCILELHLNAVSVMICVRPVFNQHYGSWDESFNQLVNILGFVAQMFCHNCSALSVAWKQPQTTCRQMNVAVFQWNFIDTEIWISYNFDVTKFFFFTSFKSTKPFLGHWPYKNRPRFAHRLQFFSSCYHLSIL